MPAHRYLQGSILDYVVVLHPEHHVKHIDQVILVKLAFGVFEVFDVMDEPLVRLVDACK